MIFLIGLGGFAVILTFTSLLCKFYEEIVIRVLVLDLESGVLSC